MRDKDLYQQILGLASPWRVEEVALDLKQEGVTVQVATPGGGTMVILERALTMSGRGKRFKGKSGDGVALKLKAAKDGSYKFTLIGKKLDLGALDTGNADLTVAFETSGAQFVRNRALVAKKGTYRLPRRRG